MAEMHTCSICRDEWEEMGSFEEQDLCDNCFESETNVCDCCENRVWVDDIHSDGNIRVCDNCYSSHYNNCYRCNCIVSNDNSYYEEDSDDPYCYQCYQQIEEDRVINNYNYKPSPIFHGDGEFFYGVELEVDDGGEDQNNARKILNVANNNSEHIYIKHDGSLDSGFEIVTHPMSLGYHAECMPWKDIMENAVAMGYRSHQSGTCGLHIHVCRSALGTTEQAQEETIARVLYFVEKFWDQMLKFSRRSEDQINRWAARYGLKNTPSQTLQDAKDKRLGRHVCINLENTHTIEFRIYRGTLKIETLLATLQMTDTICNVALSMSDDVFQNLSWNGFTKCISEDKQELINYLKFRKIYSVGDEN